MLKLTIKTAKNEADERSFSLVLAHEGTRLTKPFAIFVFLSTDNMPLFTGVTIGRGDEHRSRDVSIHRHPKRCSVRWGRS